MGQLAVTRLSDGRLQLWLAVGELFTSWQQSPDPSVPWVALTQFLPAPPLTAPPESPAGTGEVAAGHSPDGRVQLWVSGYYELLTTWKVTGDANSGWMPWETFPTPNGFLLQQLNVAQLPDGRMQLFGNNYGDPQTPPWMTWKVSTRPNAAWTEWRPFNPQPAGLNPPNDPNLIFTTGILTVASLSDGRLQAWAGAGNNTPGSIMHLISTWQTSTDPAVPWRDWDNPFNYPPQGWSYLCAAGELLDGRTLFLAINNQNVLYSCMKTSTNANSPWSGWQNPFLPDPGPVQDVAVGKLADGNLQIFVLTPSGQVLTTWTSNSTWQPWVAL